jgi:hypothetical protein
MAYPSTIDSFSTKVDSVDSYLAAHMNAVQTANVAIETELGTDPAGTATDLKTRLAKSLSGAGLLNYAASTVLTIATGSITATQNWHRVDTQSAAATDDLDTIVAGADGQKLILRISADARNVVIRHGVGNIVCGGAANITMDLTSDLVELVYDDNIDKWIANGYTNNATIAAYIASKLFYGGAYFYTATGAAATSMAIDTSLLYHALVLATTGTNVSGFTHLAGQANAIASVAENSAGVSMKVTTTGAHNLTAGQPITQTGFTTKTAYRGKKIVQSCPSATEYIVLGTYTGTDTGFMKRGFSLQCNTGSAGVYQISFSVSAEAANGATTFKFEANQNITDLDNIVSEKDFKTTGKSETLSSGGIVTLADGDYIWLSVANLTDATDLSFRHCNLVITKV